MENLKINLPQKRVKINRLFLIGNGFDLSLGLKTKYTDFLLWLLKKEVIKAINSNIFEAPFEKYKGRYDSYMEEYSKLRLGGYSENKLFDVLIPFNGYTYKIPVEKIEELESLKYFYEFIERNKIEVKTSTLSILTKKLIENSRENWVDIENIYFELLKEIIKKYKINKDGNYADLIDNINEELTEITILLKEYNKLLTFCDAFLITSVII